MKIKVIGAGLAGCEAAYQIAKYGIDVELYEMKPKKRTPAHHKDYFAELVCSNSLRARGLENAVGLLKEELRLQGSLIMEAADKNEVPAGGALAVDRDGFSTYITEKIKSMPNITVINEEISKIDDNEYTVIATGPLSSKCIVSEIERLLGNNFLYFHDAAAPIVSFDSIDMSKAFFASRYHKGDADYVNCPMNKEQYDKFYEALINAPTAELHEFEKAITVFEGCMPVEEMAKRGHDTLLFGPLKPVGLTYPDSDEMPYAVVQLRADNAARSLYNIVGFQTHLTFGAQKEVFGLIPGLENASFQRYGVMHKNTYIYSPGCLDNTYALRTNKKIRFAGQMTGVEGYVESTASGLVAGVGAARDILGLERLDYTDLTATGALAAYVSNPSISPKRFQPMNVNFGIMQPLEYKVKGGKQEKNKHISQRAIEKIKEIINQTN